MIITRLHDGLANTILIYSLIVAAWSFWIYIRRRDLTPQYWGALAIVALIFVLQAAIGVVMLFQGRIAIRGVHYLYGVLGVITLPAVFAFTRGRSTYREALFYGLTLLFLSGVVLRATITAGG